MGLRVEFVVTQAKGLAGPEEGSTAKEPDANPVIRLILIEGVGHLLLVDPDVGVELVRLIDMLKPTGWFEPAEGEFVGRNLSRIARDICHRSRVEHQALDAFFCEDLGCHATCMAGADDKNVHCVHQANQFL